MTRAHDMNRVRARREELSMLLVELAAALGRNAAFVSNVEHGFVPGHARRQQIADKLETTPELLWPEEYA